jgi:ABC-type multidrug transport system fused ATPase/permease subunit
MAVMFPIVGYYLVKIYRFTIRSYCEMNRLSSVSKSPILSHLSESIAGNSTIRAFRHQHHFLELNNSDINKQILAQQMSVGTQVWYSTQMNNISLLLMLFSSVFCILFRHTMDQVLLAMVFYQMLGLHGTMIGLLHTLANLEKKMVSV